MNDPRPAVSVWQPVCNDGGIHGMFEHRWGREEVESYVGWLDSGKRLASTKSDCGPHEAVEFYRRDRI